jgi:hypothetical protein
VPDAHLIAGMRLGSIATTIAQFVAFRESNPAQSLVALAGMMGC